MKFLICSNDKHIIKKIKETLFEKYPKSDFLCIQHMKDIRDIKETHFEIVFVDDLFEREKCIIAISFLQKKLPNARIVFVSDSIDMISELLFHIKPFGITGKSLSAKKILRYISEAKKEGDVITESFEYIEKGKKKMIPFSNIVFIESNREKLIITTINNTISIWMKMGEAERQSPHYFVRCHKSYLVNMNYIVYHENNTFQMVNGQQIAISRSKREEAEEHFDNFTASKL